VNMKDVLSAIKSREWSRDELDELLSVVKRESERYRREEEVYARNAHPGTRVKVRGGLVGVIETVTEDGLEVRSGDELLRVPFRSIVVLADPVTICCRKRGHCSFAQWDEDRDGIWNGCAMGVIDAQNKVIGDAADCLYALEGEV